MERSFTNSTTSISVPFFHGWKHPGAFNYGVGSVTYPDPGIPGYFREPLPVEGISNYIPVAAS